MGGLGLGASQLVHCTGEVGPRSWCCHASAGPRLGFVFPPTSLSSLLLGCLLGIAWAGFGVSQYCGFTLYLGLALPFPTAVGVSRWVVLENMVSEFVHFLQVHMLENFENLASI